MSLLIKALDNLDKSKQAEKSKKLENSLPVDTVLSLELAPLTASLKPENTVEVKQTAQEHVNKALTARGEAAMPTEAFLARGLSLAEEAGLNSVPSHKPARLKLAANKVAEETTNKSSSQSKPLTSNLKETLQANSVKNTAIPTAAGPSVIAPVFQDEAAQIAETNQKAAANVFVANKAVKTPTAKSALVLLAVAGVLMIWLGVQGFAYMKTLAMPVKVAVKPDPPVQPPMAVNDRATARVGTSPENTHTIDSRQTSAESAATFASNSGRDRDADNQTSISDTVVEKPNSDVLIASKSKPNSGVVENEAFRKSSGKQLKQSASEVYVGDEAASVNTPKRSQKHTTLQLVSKESTSVVDPTLLSAYQAFNRGEDASAQQQYRQVLQRDVSNVDALLGMAAIAQRQGRDADAVGWYQKVLEIEPRNTIAQSAILSSQANADVVGAESRIKSMLALQPDGANLHAALGNLYAAQNQWPAAQEAYFNASRFAPNNADYAFNLAISLDQLGKSNLALKQYERALELLNKSGATSPDRAQLEARIRALQQ